MIGHSLLSLEHCRTCKGPGTLLETDSLTVFCPDCTGSGLLWRERLFMEVDPPATRV